MMLMLPLVVALGGGTIFGRRADGASGIKDLLNAWELRGIVFMSLSIQVLLIIMGNRRKHSHGAFSISITWIAYLMADPVAAYGLGMISNKLTRSTNPRSDINIELSAFWAPFLLLHLGGPDTITAYALEDNQLWLRHMLSLLTQTGATLYTFLLAWNGSNLSILTIWMIFAGLSKYAERVWVLWEASTERFRDSIPENKVVEEQKLRETEGFYVVPHEVLEVREVVLDNTSQGTDFSENNIYKRSLSELLAADGLFNIFRQLFSDLLLSLRDREDSLAILQDKNFQVAFKIIEIELGIMYDMLYTKAMVVNTVWGVGRRIVVMLFLVVVLVKLLLVEIHKSHSRVDLGMTFLLLGVAIFLEAYALMFLAFSDKVACWLIKNKKLNVLKVINRLQPLSARKRWSGTVAQFNLLSFSIKKNHLFCDQLLKLLKIDENIEKYMYKSHENVPDGLKELIIERLHKWKSTGVTRGRHALEISQETDKLGWSIELEFDQSIVIWYIATELCENPDNRRLCALSEEHNQRVIDSDHKLGKLLSRYLMYLLVFHPYMLPMGVGRLKFKDTYSKAMKFFDEQNSTGKGKREKGKTKLSEARKQLRDHVKTKYNLTIAKEDKSNYVLFHGCLLASQLQAISDNPKRWMIIKNVWVEMLVFAASKCKGTYHSQQLRRGGEFLTHVWLLMAHFGMTENLQILPTPSITEFTVR